MFLIKYEGYEDES